MTMPKRARSYLLTRQTYCKPGQLPHVFEFCGQAGACFSLGPFEDALGTVVHSALGFVGLH